MKKLEYPCWSMLIYKWPLTGGGGTIDPIWQKVEDAHDGEDRTYKLFPSNGASYRFSISRNSPTEPVLASESSPVSAVDVDASPRTVFVPGAYGLWVIRTDALTEVAPALLYVSLGNWML